MKSLSCELKEWVENNEFYNGGVLTNELKFNQKFGQNIQNLTVELEYHNQNIIARQLFDSNSRLVGRLRKIDDVCRKGCRTHEEFLELDFIRSRAVGLARELAELLEMVEKYQRSDVRIQASEKDDWITLADAAKLLVVHKSTISRWADSGRLTDNGQPGRDRRLLKSSVTLVKQQIEDGDILRDAEELRRDTRKC